MAAIQQVLLALGGSAYWITTFYQLPLTIESHADKIRVRSGRGERSYMIHHDTTTSQFKPWSVFLNSQGLSNGVPWVETETGTNDDTNRDFLHDIKNDSDGNYYILYYLESAIAASGYFLTKFNSTGSVQWTRKFVPAVTGSKSTESGYLVVSDSGDIYIAINIRSNTLGLGSFVIKCDSSGNTLWQRHLAFEGAIDTYGMSLTASGLAVLGSTVSGNEAGIFLYNTSGTLLSYHKLDQLDATHFFAIGRLAQGSESSSILGVALEIADTVNGTYASHVLKMDLTTFASSTSKVCNNTLSNPHFPWVEYNYTLGELYAIFTDGTLTFSDIHKFDSSGSQMWARSISPALYDGSTSLHTDGSFLMGLTSFDNKLSSVMKVPSDGSKTGSYSVSAGSSSMTIDYTSSVRTTVDGTISWTLSTGFTDVAGDITPTTPSMTAGGVTEFVGYLNI